MQYNCLCILYTHVYIHAVHNSRRKYFSLNHFELEDFQCKRKYIFIPRVFTWVYHFFCFFKLAFYSLQTYICIYSLYVWFRKQLLGFQKTYIYTNIVYISWIALGSKIRYQKAFRQALSLLARANSLVIIVGTWVKDKENEKNKRYRLRVQNSSVKFKTLARLEE